MVLATALYLRIQHLSQLPVDHLDESYHRWLIDVLTLRNNGLYTGYGPMPNTALVLLPLYQYISVFAMVATGQQTILIPRLVSLAAGSLTCLLSERTAYKLYRSHWFAAVAGLVLATQPWHIDFSTLATDKAVVGLLLMTAIYFLVSAQPLLFAATSFLLMLTSYEGWVLTVLLVLVAHLSERWRRKPISNAIGAIAIAFVGWSIWSFVNARNPFAWISTYLAYIDWRPRTDPALLIFYPTIATFMTSAVFLIAIVSGLRHSSRTRALAALMVLYTAIFVVASYFGLDTGEVDRIVPLLPIMALIVPPVLSKPVGRRSKRVLIVLALLMLLVIPYYLQISIGPAKTFAIFPEDRVGRVLNQAYQGGMILNDLPTVIYYSNLDPGTFLSFNSLEWYAQSRDNGQLEMWLRVTGVSLVVWHNVTWSRAPALFPDLGLPKNYTPSVLAYGNVTFVLVYEDSSEAGFWEHSPEYRGPPPIFVYRIEYETSPVCCDVRAT